MNKNEYSLPRRRSVVLAIASALAAFSATPALADEPLIGIKLFRDADVMFRDADMSRWADNYVELGIGYNSKDSLRFGQFSGLTDAGAFPLAGFNWLARDKANDAQYWRAYGASLGLDSRKVQAEAGVQGRWNLDFSIDQLLKSQTDTARFHHQGLGSSSLTLPANVTRQATATAANFPDSQFNKFDIQHGRDIYRLGANGLLANGWGYKVNYREDHRDGTRLTGFVYSGGTASVVPYQIDDKTQQIEAILSWTSKVAQMQLGYTYSRFVNNLSAFDVQSPFSGSQLNNRLSLAPDNDYHQLNASGAYNFSKTTRLNANLSYGVARQNESFLPYSVNGTTAAASTTAGLPRSSLDGKVVNTLLDIALTTKPIDKMNLKVAYQYRDSDNRTPISQFTYVARDSAAGVPLSTANAATTRSNAPVSSTEQKFIVDGDYEIAARTLLRAGLEHSRKDYTLTDRAHTDTNRLSLELRRPVSDEFLGSVGYIYTERRGSEYDKNVFFRNSYTSAAYQTNTAGGSLTNHPSMRSFMYADFDEHRLRGSGNWTVSETVSLQGSVDRYDNRAKDQGCNNIADPNVQAAINKAVADPSLKLPDTCLGRKLAEGTNVNFDLQWQPDETLTTFAFYNLAETRMKQAGRTWRTDAAAGAVPDESATAADTRRDWNGHSIYRDHSLGVGLKWQAEEKWDVGGTYVFSYGTGETSISQSAAPAVGGGAGNAAALTASTPLPNNWSKLHSLQLFAKWDYSKQLTWRFNYLYENLRSYDWATSDIGTTITGNTNVILTGQQAPRYSNHVVGVSALFKSW